MNISYFDKVNVYGIINWLNALKLLSAICKANYIFTYSKIKQMKTTQKNLLKLIKVYKLYNNIIGHNYNSDNKININLHIQQMFYTLLHKKYDKKEIMKLHHHHYYNHYPSKQEK